MGVEQRQVALTAIERINFKRQGPMPGIKPEARGHGLVKAQTNGAAELPPALLLVAAPAQDRCQQVFLMEEQRLSIHP